MTEALTFWGGCWYDGAPPIMSPMTHAAWMASIVFDGARTFDGRTPDLDRHCRRLVDSAGVIGLNPTMDADAIEQICRDGIAKFPADAALYIRPSFFAESGFVAPDPDSTRFSLILFARPMPAFDAGLALCVSALRRPAADQAPTAAKAACHYPQAGIGLLDAKRRGYDDALIMDPEGAVAETMMRNAFFVHDGVVHTPAANGAYLAGITRSRVLDLLRADGVVCAERTIQAAEFETADEIFVTANAGKVQPVTRFEGRDLPAGSVTRRAWDLYRDFAASGA